MEFVEKFSCHREENFSEMYSNLGRAEKQEEIRAEHKDAKHCVLLKECPTACIALHKDIEETKAGEPCPNNPTIRFKKKYDCDVEHAEILEQCSYFEDLMVLNMLPPINAVSPVVFAVLRVVRVFRDQRSIMMEQMRSMMSTAATTSAMFGGGDKGK